MLSPKGDAYDRLFYNTELLKKGFFAFSTVEQDDSDTSLIIYHRKYRFFQGLPEKRKARSTFHLLQSIGSLSQEITILPKSICPTIANQENWDESFFPCILNTESGKRGAFYLYPWLSSHGKTKLTLSKFNSFVTASCMFGTNLRLIDRSGKEEVLIQHHNDFPDQQFIDVNQDWETLHPYEHLQFFELEKLGYLIKHLSAIEKPILYYHLPAIDYLLYIIKLFALGKLTLEVLEKCFFAIVHRYNQHKENIYNICKKHNIEVSIQSPFDNILPRLDSFPNAHAVLEFLKLPVADVTINIGQEKIEEEKLVELFVNKLKAGNTNLEHFVLWQEIFSKKNTIENLEELFSLGNIVMIALATTENYKTCCLLPLDEKQIALAFRKNKHELPLAFPNTINLTYLPHLAYPHSLFYLSRNQSELIKLMQKKQLLQIAFTNASNYLTDEGCSSQMDDIGERMKPR